MNTTTHRFLRSHISGHITATILLLIMAASLHAQGRRELKETTVAWINTVYGPDNTGLGLCARHGAVGFGTTVFRLALDTITNSKQSGVLGVSVSGYLIGDFSEWLAIYGSIGGGGHFATYGISNKAISTHRKYGFMSVGTGFQISIAHIMMGIGYGISFDTGGEERTAAYDPIHSVVAQLGYRL
jgi:hypothetical protein